MKKTNKKIIIIVLAVIAVICAAVAIIVSQTTKLTNESYENCAVGDVNGDGYINSQDVLLIRSALAGQSELFENQRKNGDTDADGKLTEKDAEIILRYATGEIRKLPYTSDSSAGISENEKMIQSSTQESETTVKIVNKWANGDGTYSYQLNISLRNLKESRLRGWKTLITLSGDVEESKSWDCECEVNGKTITIEGETIPAETVGVCGVIVIGEENLKLETVETTE